MQQSKKDLFPRLIGTVSGLPRKSRCRHRGSGGRPVSTAVLRRLRSVPYRAPRRHARACCRPARGGFHCCSSRLGQGVDALTVDSPIGTHFGLKGHEPPSYNELSACEVAAHPYPCRRRVMPGLSPGFGASRGVPVQASIFRGSSRGSCHRSDLPNHPLPKLISTPGRCGDSSSHHHPFVRVVGKGRPVGAVNRCSG